MEWLSIIIIGLGSHNFVIINNFSYHTVAVAVVCFILGLLSLIFCMRRIFCRSKFSGGDFQAEMSSSMNTVVLNGSAGASRGQTKEDNK